MKIKLALIALCPLLAAGAISEELGEDAVEPLETLIVPEVLTPVRLKQPRTEVPASVTVIDHELITATGARELPEILRLVPGMVASARSGWDYAVSYHGTNRRNSRRMQVLIDGRSVYQAGLATIDWSDIPLAIEDIERIEVTRGPDTAAYGANAFLGIINIITKHPDDSEHLRVKATYGSSGTENYYASTSGTLADSSYRLTLAKRRDNGFDTRYDGSERHDTKDPHFINGRWLLNSSEYWNLGAQFGYKNGDKTDDTNEPNVTPPDVNQKEYYGSITSQFFLSDLNSLKLQFDYSHAEYTTEYRSCQDFGIVLCGDINDNSENSRIDVDLQDTWLGGSDWKLVSGTHLQQKKVDSETFYNGRIDHTNYQLFANFEYRFSPLWSTTIAGSQEYPERGGSDFSPRLALLFAPDKRQTFRLVYSEAVRTPDLYENNLDWNYSASRIAPLTPIPGFVLPIPDPYVIPIKKSLGNLHEEHIRSREFGYYGLWFDGIVELDAKLYNDDLTELISENLTNSALTPTNSTSVNQTGFETEINIHPSEPLRIHLTYAQINSDEHSSTNPSTGRNEHTLTPRHAGSTGAMYTVGNGLMLSSFYYFAYPVNDTKLSRWDSRIAQQFPFFAGNLTLGATVQHYFYKYSDYFRDNTYDSPNRFLLTAELSY
jgi:iron complex outermembrane receptor protein